MTLQECLNRLARGTLSNTSMAVDGYIKPECMEKILDAFNEALLRIYTAIPIKESWYTLEIEDGVDSYELPKDALTVFKVFNEKGEPYYINNPEAKHSVYINGSNIIFKCLKKEKTFTVVYRVKPIKYSAKDLEKDIELPDNLMGAIYSYIAYLIHSYMNTEQAVANAQKYMSEYKMIISEVIQEGTINPQSVLNGKKFIDRGFV